MKRAGRWCAMAALLAASAAWAAEDYSFDAADFEKKPFELGGYAQLRGENARLRGDSVFYRLNNFGQAPRGDLTRVSGIVELAGKARYGDGTFDFRTHSQAQQDEAASSTDNVLYEGAYTLRATPALSLEAGKRVMRWGKGYAFNPVGFVERPKDPNDPELAREGYWLASADYIRNFDGALQTLAFTPVVVPVGRDVNSDFGATQHLNPAAKLYMLYRDTDIDLVWQGKGSRPARYGFDFSRNVTSNFEVHGEWARTQDVTRRVADSNGRITATTGNATSYLLGLRYLTESNTTYIAEYYRNGTGYSADESRTFYRFVDDAFARLAASGDASMVQKAIAFSQGSYGRPNPGSQYLYVRAQQKDAFGIVYFQPGVTAMLNLDDRSFQVTPELLYTGFHNIELRARVYVLQGDRNTDFGAKQNSRKFELQARLYF